MGRPERQSMIVCVKVQLAVDILHEAAEVNTITFFPAALIFSASSSSAPE
jgi:hypothetical protein